MIYENLQINSQPSHRGNEADGALPTLNDNDLQLLVRFFQLLDEWDRRPRPKRSPLCVEMSCPYPFMIERCAL
jgi:hypothetical protein